MLDLRIKNGRTIDGQQLEIGITDGKITDIAKEITAPAVKTLVLTDEQCLSAGWIDEHVHCFEEMSLYYDYPDEIGVAHGVTTVIDAGTTGAENIGRFYELSAAAKTNVFSLVNISKWGIVEQDELADLTKIKKDLIHNALAAYPDFIVGLKARMSKTVVGNNGITPLELAKEIQKETGGLPLMVHIGSAPPSLAEILSHLEAGDIMTHCFNGKENGILDRRTDQIKPFVWEAYKRGVSFDIGHGTDSFNFDVAEKAYEEGMKAATISTDIYIRNRKNGPVYDLATTMEKLHVVGYSWSEIIEKVTKEPAREFKLTTKGQLAIGMDGDITVFTFADGAKTLTDSNGNTRVTKQQIKPVTAIIGGIVYDC